MIADDESDPPILHRVAAGDELAVRACMDRFGPLIWSLARRMLANRDEAEDAVQDIFVDVWRSSERYDPSVASETAFVATIARRRLIDRRRRAARRPEAELLPETIEADEDAIDERLADCDEAALAERELEQLKPEQQQVLRLSIWEGLSHSAIAERTGMPLGTVKTHARRGLIQIRDSIARARGEQ
ncbi:MAG: sigma-70 family RNA polymerase sigma factor [Planctomycetota bacterium]